MIDRKHGQGTHSTKMGADKSAENTPKNLSTMYKFSFEHGNFFGKRIKENKLNNRTDVLMEGQSKEKISP